jgi:hypothetical protein
MLLQGPDLTNNLIGVLLRFRQEGIAFMADIQKMFYQVRVPVKHRNYLRFFWYPGGDLNRCPIEYRVTVHIFGAVSSPSIANFTLRELTNLKEAQEFSQESRDSIKNNFYVDDIVKSVCNEEQAVKLVKEVTKLLTLGGFKLTAFVSNSRAILKTIPQEDLVKNLKNLNLSMDSLSYEQALGVRWNLENDALGFNIKLPEKKYTRRGVLSTVFSIYDPLGLVSPVVLFAKRIFQETCYDGLKWDDQLPIGLLKKWQKWLEEVELISSFQIPRCFKMGSTCSEAQLHIFCDGSQTAYAAVAYYRCITEKEASCSLIIAKTRLVPLKGSALATVPRIELNGAKLAVQLRNKIVKELEINFSQT